MAEAADYSQEAYTAYIAERTTLIEAARESAKTFDQAVLAFGSAVFGASIAFLKDVAPHPQRFTLKWLAGAWLFFSLGLLAALLSFIWSHRACMRQVEIASATLLRPDEPEPQNKWSTRTDWCNYLCILLLFTGLASWSVFALENLNQGESMADQTHTRVPQQGDLVQKGYVPPKAAVPPPRSVTTPQPQPPAQK